MRYAFLGAYLLPGLLLAQTPDTNQHPTPASRDSTQPLAPRLQSTTIPRLDLGPVSSDPIEVDKQPAFDSVQAWYWPKGKVGKRAKVVLQGVVDTNGRVEPESITLVSTTDSLFIEPAKLTFMVVYYHPGKAGGRPVRVLVQQPLSYGTKGHWCELKGPTPLLPPKCFGGGGSKP